jgi:glutathionyl-hydroquinone reductase
VDVSRGVHICAYARVLARADCVLGGCVWHADWSHESINPKRRIPKGGIPNHLLPHDRNRFAAKATQVLGASDAALHAGAKKGEFVRPDSKFRNWISASGESDFPAEAGRYHLYIA